MLATNKTIIILKLNRNTKNIKIYFLSQLKNVIINNLFNFLKTSPTSIYVKAWSLYFKVLALSILYKIT